MAYPERYDPVGVQIRITGIKNQEKIVPSAFPRCDYERNCARDAAFECTPDGGSAFYRCHKHRPDTL